MTQKKLLGYASALGYAAIVGFSFIFVKEILAHTDPLNILTLRFGLALIPLLAVYPFLRQKADFSLRRIRPLLPLGIFYPFLFFGAQAFALSVSSSIEVGAVQATAPIFTLILAGIFLREKTNALQKLSVVLCVGGVMYIMVMKFIKNAAPDFSGIAIALVGTIAFSIYTVLNKRLRVKVSNYELLTVIVAESFLILLMITLVKNLGNGSFFQAIRSLRSKDFLIGIGYLAFLSTLSSGYLINFALANIEASKMIVFNNLGTVIQILAGVIILKETLYPSHIIGSIAIILGILGVNLLGQVSDVKTYVPKFWLIGSVVSFIAGIFTFIMGAQNMSSHFVGSEGFQTMTAEAAALSNLGNSYAMSFYLMTLIFVVAGIGCAILSNITATRFDRERPI